MNSGENKEKSNQVEITKFNIQYKENETGDLLYVSADDEK